MLVHYVAKGSTLPGFVSNQHRGIEGSGLQCEEDSSQLATCSHIYTHTQYINSFKDVLVKQNFNGIKVKQQVARKSYFWSSLYLQ